MKQNCASSWLFSKTINAIYFSWRSPGRHKSASLVLRSLGFTNLLSRVAVKIESVWSNGGNDNQKGKPGLLGEKPVQVPPWPPQIQNSSQPIPRVICDVQGSRRSRLSLKYFGIFLLSSLRQSPAYIFYSCTINAVNLARDQATAVRDKWLPKQWHGPKHEFRQQVSCFIPRN